jgi:hypothetical protein
MGVDAMRYQCPARKLRLGAASILLLVQLACAPWPPPGAILVERRPPPELVEVVTVGPGAGYVWLRGYWRWGRLDFDWVPGRWMMLERGYRSWVPGRWVHSRQGWYWVSGYWN